MGVSRRYLYLLALLALWAVPACTEGVPPADPAPTPMEARTRVERPAAARHYGNMPLILDPTNKNGLFHFEPLQIAEDSNLLALHMDWFPSPWREFAAGTAPARAWELEMARIDAVVAELGLPVYLALTPIGGDHNKLKPQAAGESALEEDHGFSGEVCQSIADRDDYESVVVPGYRAFVSAMVERFEPIYLAISIEINDYARQCPAAWAALERLLNEVYEEQKALRPELVVFNTYQIDTLWEAAERHEPCFGYRLDCVEQNVKAILGLETDVFAISTYPIGALLNNGSLPDDYLSIFSTMTDAPLAVAETGYPASTISGLDGETCVAGLPSTPEDQNRWMERLLAEAADLEMPFVIWWANTDLASVETLGGCRCPDSGSDWCQFLNRLPRDAAQGIRFFGVMGLRASDGTPRLARESWAAAVEAAANEAAP